MPPTVNLVGLVLLDAMCRDFSRCPERGEPPEHVATDITWHAGGGAANTSAALAQLGLHTRVFGRLGDDAYGRRVVADLQRHGVCTRHISRVPGEQSTWCFVGIHPDGEHTFVCTYGASHDCSPADVPADVWADGQAVVYQGIG